MTHSHIPEFSSIEEILQFAINEENDAYNYYLEASERITDPKLKQFLIDLAAMEIEHSNMLKEKLKEYKANIFCTDAIISSFTEEIQS